MLLWLSLLFKRRRSSPHNVESAGRLTCAFYNLQLFLNINLYHWKHNSKLIAPLRTAHSRWSSRIAVRGGRKRAATCRTHATARRKRQTELCGLCAWCCSVSLQRCISNNHLNLRKIIDKKLIKTIANAIAAETHHAE